MRFWLRCLLFLGVALAATLFSVHNRHSITLSLFPLPFELEAPAFLALLIAFVCGFVLSRITLGITAVRQKWQIRNTQHRVDALTNELHSLKLEQSLKQPPHPIV